MSTTHQKSWVSYNEKTATYDTPDGTAVPEEMVNSARCLLDVFHICDVRAEQRAAKLERAKP